MQFTYRAVFPTGNYLRPPDKWTVFLLAMVQVRSIPVSRRNTIRSAIISIGNTKALQYILIVLTISMSMREDHIILHNVRLT